MGSWMHGVNISSTKVQVLPSEINNCAHAHKYVFLIVVLTVVCRVGENMELILSPPTFKFYQVIVMLLFMLFFFHIIKHLAIEPMGKGNIFFSAQGHTTIRLQIITVQYEFNDVTCQNWTWVGKITMPPNRPR